MAVFFTLGFKGQIEVFGNSLPSVILPVKSYERTDIKFITSWTIPTLSHVHAELFRHECAKVKAKKCSLDCSAGYQ